MHNVLTGRVHSLQTSPGGVPKLPVAEVNVGVVGIAGDGHHDLKHHGGPDRAVSLWSLEAIEALSAEGHAVFPGSAGENVTLSGLLWADISLNATLAIGDELILEISDYAAPCRTIQAQFTDHRFGRVSQKSHPGWSRLYARVLREGTIRTGDVVFVTLNPSLATL